MFVVRSIGVAALAPDKGGKDAWESKLSSMLDRPGLRPLPSGAAAGAAPAEPSLSEKVALTCKVAAGRTAGEAAGEDGTGLPRAGEAVTGEAPLAKGLAIGSNGLAMVRVPPTPPAGGVCSKAAGESNCRVKHELLVSQGAGDRERLLGFALNVGLAYRL